MGMEVREVTSPHGRGLWKKISMGKHKFIECGGRWIRATEFVFGMMNGLVKVDLKINFRGSLLLCH